MKNVKLFTPGGLALTAVLATAIGVSTALLQAAAQDRQPGGKAGPKLGGTGAGAPVDPHTVIEGWPEPSKTAARDMLKKYGPPAVATVDVLVWNATGPFKRTHVYRNPIIHNFPKPHDDVVLQVVDYKVPPDQFDDLARVDGSIIAWRTGGELGSFCQNEETNLLALNVANDVCLKRKKPEEARRYYTEAIRKLAEGKKDPYLEALRFEVAKEGAADPDTATLPVGKP